MLNIANTSFLVINTFYKFIFINKNFKPPDPGGWCHSSDIIGFAPFNNFVYAQSQLEWKGLKMQKRKEMPDQTNKAPTHQKCFYELAFLFGMWLKIALEISFKELF